MKAFQLFAWQKPPELREVAMPKPGPGQILVKVGGAGVRTFAAGFKIAPPMRQAQKVAGLNGDSTPPGVPV
jgi:NADPH:quinone reductase-like Zn-dependent oxidoreductase